MLVELHNTGNATVRTEVQAVVEHILSGRPGEWRVSIVGSRAKEDWEMKVEGPNGFERSYTLVGSAGEHQPMAIRESALETAALEDLIRSQSTYLENPPLGTGWPFALNQPRQDRGEAV